MPTEAEVIVVGLLALAVLFALFGVVLMAAWRAKK
jgi:hypothetical protein